MPNQPLIVSGTTKNSFGNLQNAITISFTNSSGVNGSAVSNAQGQYLFDLANIGYSDGETITYKAEDDQFNELFEGSFVVSGVSQTLNITLSTRIVPLVISNNRGTQMNMIGGKVVTGQNPFPVQISKIPVNDGEFTLSYDPSNNLTSVVKVINNRTYTRTLAYDSSNNLTSISRWVVS